MEGMEHNLDTGLKDVLEAIQARIMDSTYYFGVKTLKCPMDFWTYQEIIFEVKPDVIVEIGNYNGGSTLALAHILDHLGHGRVIGIDISHDNVPDIVRRHPRITLITGDACSVFDEVKALVNSGDKVIIIEDSSHEYENTLNVLRKYGELVSANSYFIVEDSICHHGLNVGPDPGPYEAVEAFVRENGSFVADRARESFFITWNPKGFLKKAGHAAPLLSEKEIISSRIIEQKLLTSKNPYVCFSGGKKSTVLVHLMKKCAGTGLNLIYVDTGMQFGQIDSYVNKMSRLWGFNLIKVKPDGAGMVADHEACCKTMIAGPLIDAVKRLGIDTLFVGGAPDGKNGAWKTPAAGVNLVFPMAHFSDDDVCEYARHNDLTTCSLYDAGYSTIHCKPCSEPGAGRAPIASAGEETTIKEKLRRLGYL